MHQRNQKNFFNYIVFEGIDGSGKTTQARMFVEYLKSEREDVFFVSEPYDTRLRELLLNENFNNKAKLFMFLSDRSQLSEIIKSKIKRGIIVVSDRSMCSTLAYQGYGDGMDLDFLNNLNLFATDNLIPDVVFCIDIPVEMMGERIGKMDFIESKGYEFFSKVREGYLKLGEHCKNYFIVDGNREREKVFEDIKSIWISLVDSLALS